MYRRKKEKKQKLSQFGDSVYAAEKLIDRRKKKNGKIEYLVKWRGYSLKEASWEPLINIIDDRLIEDFEKNHLQRTKTNVASTSKLSLNKSIQTKQKETTKPEKDDDQIYSNKEEVTKKSSQIETRDVIEDNETKLSKNLESIEKSKDEPTSAIEDKFEENIQKKTVSQTLTSVNVEEEMIKNEQIESESDQSEEIELQEETTVDQEITGNHLLIPESKKIETIEQNEESMNKNSIMLSNQHLSIQPLQVPKQKQLNSPNRIKQTSLLRQKDSSNSLSSIIHQRNESFVKLTNQVQSPKQTKSVPIIKKSLPIQNHHLSISDETDLSNSLDNSLDNNLSFNVINLTNSMLCNNMNSGNISLNNLSSPSSNHNSYNMIYSLSPSSNRSSNQFRQTIINPLNTVKKSNSFKNNQISHNLINVVQPIPSNLDKIIINQVNQTNQAKQINRVNPSLITQQTVSPRNQIYLNQKIENDQQQVTSESTKLTTFQETSDAILNSKRFVKRHVPPNLFWKNNILANQLVITDVINNDNELVTIRECKIQEFFREKSSKKKKAKHKNLKMKSV